MNRPSVVLLASFLVLALTSCTVVDHMRTHGKKPVADVYDPPKDAPKQPEISKMTEPVVLKKIDSLAVLPFSYVGRLADNTLNPTDLVQMSEAFANHLVGSSTFKTLLYPQQAIDALSKSNLNMMEDDDLKEIGNLLDVDALVFGVIKDYNMYYPPRLSISMRFYLTRLGRFASSEEISDLAHSGVPLLTYNPTFFRQLWDHSGFYDGSNKQFAETLAHFLKSHSADFSGLGAERYKRTKADFLNIVTYDLANSLNCVKTTTEDENQKQSPPSKGRKQTVAYPQGYFHR